MSIFIIVSYLPSQTKEDYDIKWMIEWFWIRTKHTLLEIGGEPFLHDPNLS